MMTFTTIIPTQRNDGRPVRKRELAEIRKRLIEQFGGATFEGMVDGYWIDGADGRHYRDPGIKVTIGCDRERLQEAIDAVREIGSQLDQKAMWFEVRYYDGPQILRID